MIFCAKANHDTGYINRSKCQALSFCHKSAEVKPECWQICSGQLLYGHPSLCFHVHCGGHPSEIN